MRCSPRSLALLAGLAVSASASAQYAIVTNQPGSFTDISGTGTLVGNGDDNTYQFTSAVGNGLFPAGTIYACTNGFLSSGATNPGSSFTNSMINATGVPSGLTAGASGYLLPFWDDLQSTADPNSQIYRLESNGVLIVQWNNYGHFSSTTGQTVTFQVKIFNGPNPAGGIYAQFIYQDTTFGGSYAADNGASATIGFVGNGSTTGNIPWSFNQAVVTPATVLSFVVAGTGACCLPDGTCQAMATNLCSAQGGLYRGDNTSCDGQSCPQPGACCRSDGSCSILGAAQCAAIAYASFAGSNTTCAGTSCPTGACCVNLSCVLGNAASCAGQAGIYRGDGTACATAGCPGPTAGPDVWVSSLTDVGYFATVGSITGYAVGTVACNQGDVPVSWVAGTSAHPVVAQNMFRLMNGHFEQLGQSWLKHTFASTNSPGCGTCVQPPNGGAQLGVGCSDAYGSGLNGSQGSLGPRSQVNGTTGVFPYPFSAPAVTTAVDRLLQVPTTDVTPANNPGALYFVDAHYVTADDASWNDGLNNCTYQQVTIPNATTSPSLTGAVHARSPGIQAWKDQDPAVTIASADYTESNLTGRFWVAGKATNNGNGTWHYEYAVYNLNANRAAGTFSIPVDPATVVSNLGFHAPQSHSGEPYSNTAWASAVSGGALTFSTTPYATNPNANAIRWGTMYNFRFDATASPSTGTLTLGLFAPGSPTSLSIAGLPVPSPCYANCDGSSTPPALNVLDFSCFLNRFAAADSYANCDHSTTAPVLNVLDFACFLNAFAAGCP